MRTHDLKQPLNPTEIRETLREWVDIKFSLTENDILINELGFYNKDKNSSVDNSYRADLVLANGRLVGFEIKSEKDSLKRWELQKEAYTNVFDEVWLCTHGKHLEKALASTPKHIGIMLVDNTKSIAIARDAIKNHGLNNVYDLIGLLWREEINELSKMYGIPTKTRATKKEARENLAKEISLKEARQFTLEKLKLRKA